MTEKETQEQLAANLKLCRKECGYTQDEVAKYLEISQPAYNKYERCETPINHRHLEKLGRLYGISPYKLISEKSVDLSASIAFAYRKTGNPDLNSVAAFKSIVMNYIFMCDELAKD